MDAKQAVLDAMQAAKEPLSAGQIAEKTGLERKAVDKAMDELKKAGAITSPKRCYWQPS
jgi:biotin operon repressor